MKKKVHLRHFRSARVWNSFDLLDSLMSLCVRVRAFVCTWNSHILSLRSRNYTKISFHFSYSAIFSPVKMIKFGDMNGSLAFHSSHSQMAKLWAMMRKTEIYRFCGMLQTAVYNNWKKRWLFEWLACKHTLFTLERSKFQYQSLAINTLDFFINKQRKQQHPNIANALSVCACMFARCCVCGMKKRVKIMGQFISIASTAK